MLSNLGSTDRTIRAASGVFLAIVAAIMAPSILTWVLGGVALVLIATSAVGTCPAYLPFGFSTKAASRISD